MNKIKSLLLTMAMLATVPLLAADKPAVVKEEAKPYGFEAVLEPYGTLSWKGINGQHDLGAGASLAFPIGPQGLALVGFGEADNVHNQFIERFGGGLRYTAYIGKYVSMDGGVAGAYDVEDPHFFIRLPLGVNLTPYRSKNVDISFRAQWAFDISGHKSNGSSSSGGGVTELGEKGEQCSPKSSSGSGNAHDGVATGRLFIGPVATFKF